MSTATTLLWRGGLLEPLPDARRGADCVGAVDTGAAEPTLLVADSWLVDEGRVRALDVHRDRFAGSVDAATAGMPGRPTPDDVDAFWTAVVARLPRTGRWFPRVELVGVDGTGTTDAAGGVDGRDATGGADSTRASSVALRLRLRPAPPASATVVLATAAHDPRVSPLVKGPDLVALGRVRDEARSRGADEAVVLSGDGHVVDGAWSSIVWWRGDALCLPSDDLPRLPGVTVRTLATLAAVMGVDVLHEHARPDELSGFEVWTTSALHGIRIATGWVDGPSPAEQPGRLALWRSRLDALRRPLPSA